ncbi:hypothetical protein D1AOALGA4SA_6447 [Olavius algarvensis Delta 1 endosymbiont]|nr:hypothetical protein D1AOALGA4SA_6447 [Olavius algarvensis Delta 1 endosymbiont]
MSQITWSSGPVVEPVFFTGVRDNRLCHLSKLIVVSGVSKKPILSPEPSVG